MGWLAITSLGLTGIPPNQLGVPGARRRLARGNSFECDNCRGLRGDYGDYGDYGDMIHIA